MKRVFLFLVLNFAVMLAMMVDRVISNSSGFFHPKWSVRLPCGSLSIKSTLYPCLTRATPKLTVVVVFPTPPFWLANAITFVISNTILSL